MKVRIKFQKYGAMKFIGHLDIMRYFQKAFRRANIDSEYTKGFTPHQIMSFAAPLGVGLTSDSEYVDLQLYTSDTPEIMLERMNTVQTEGIRIIGFHALKEREEHQKAVTAMSLVSAADYLVSLKDGYCISCSIHTQEEFKKAFDLFASSQEIIIDKKTKTSEKAVDIKPMIRLVAFEEKDYKEKKRQILQGVSAENSLEQNKQENATEVSESSEENKQEGANDLSIITEENIWNSVADVYESGIKVYLQLDTGSSINLKPELAIEAFYDSLGIPFEKFAWQVHRLEIYTKVEERGKLAELDQVER